MIWQKNTNNRKNLKVILSSFFRLINEFRGPKKSVATAYLAFALRRHCWTLVLNQGATRQNWLRNTVLGSREKKGLQRQKHDNETGPKTIKSS